MDWLTAHLNAPYGSALLAAFVLPVVLGIFYAFNRHPAPIPTWRLWANRAVVVAFFGAVIIYGM